MLARNPLRMDYQRKYEEIVADYNREKDRTTIEETFRRLVELVNSLDEEQKRATQRRPSRGRTGAVRSAPEGRPDKADRERVKQASRDLLASIKARLAELDRFWEKEQTKADVEVFILDEVFASLPTPPFTHRGEEAGRRQRLCPRLAAGHERRVSRGRRDVDAGVFSRPAAGFQC